MCQCMGGVGCGSGGWIEVWLDQGGVAQEFVEAQRVCMWGGGLLGEY